LSSNIHALYVGHIIYTSHGGYTRSICSSLPSKGTWAVTCRNGGTYYL